LFVGTCGLGYALLEKTKQPRWDVRMQLGKSVPAPGHIDSSLKRYIAREMYAIWGNLKPVDAACYATLLRFQTVEGISGGAAEIGVSQGRSLFMLAKALLPNERVYGIDLFNHDTRGYIGTGQLEAFKLNAVRLGLSIPDECIHIGPSEHLKVDDILRVVGPVRFFHVDGGHREFHVKSDAKLAASSINDAGVIAFDDFSNPEWPEVCLGVLDFLRSNEFGLAPFAITKDKIYVCRSGHKQKYVDALVSSDWLRGYRFGWADLLGSKIVFIRQETSDRLLYHVLGKLGLGDIAYWLQARRRY
jgi:methyltransferase family protein